MSSPYVGEIRMFGGNFAPVGWAFCAGQLLPISENDALFNLIGTTYGGDGQETFALPNLQSRVPIHVGNSLTLGDAAGAEAVTLNTNQIPTHSHPVLASSSTASQTTPLNNVLGVPTVVDLYRVGAASVALAPAAVSTVGGSQPHENCQPFLCVSFIISLFGVFPQQT